MFAITVTEEIDGKWYLSHYKEYLSQQSAKSFLKKYKKVFEKKKAKVKIEDLSKY